MNHSATPFTRSYLHVLLLCQEINCALLTHTQTRSLEKHNMHDARHILHVLNVLTLHVRAANLCLIFIACAMQLTLWPFSNISSIRVTEHRLVLVHQRGIAPPNPLFSRDTHRDCIYEIGSGGDNKKKKLKWHQDSDITTARGTVSPSHKVCTLTQTWHERSWKTLTDSHVV